MRIEDESCLDLFRKAGRCGWCRKSRPTDPHHLWGRGHGGGFRLDVPINLIALCRACHDEFHDGKIARFDLLAMVAQRENVLQGEIESVYWFIQRIPKHFRPEKVHETAKDELSTSEQALLWKSLGWSEKKARRA
jgi:hypothetical protein